MIRQAIGAVLVVASALWIAGHALVHAILTVFGVPCP